MRGAELPFLIVHGALISKLAIAVPVVLAAAVAWWLRVRAERARVRAVVGRLARQVTGLDAGVAVLRGKLVGERVLEVGGEKIEMTGEIRALAGARGPASGDEIIASGVLAARASDAAADYREKAGGWVLDHAPDVPFVEIVATSPVVRTPLPHPARAIALVAVFVAVTYGTLRTIGAAAIDRAEHMLHEDRHSVAGLGTAVAIAAALPHTRERALELAQDVIEIQMPHDATSDALRVEIRGLRHDCPGKVNALLSSERFEEGEAAARECGDDADRAVALALLGRFDEALPFVMKGHDHDRSWGDRAATIALAAGAWQEAATALDVVADGWESESVGGGDPDTGLIVADHVHRARCLAEWARLHAGDTGALARMQKLVADADPTACRIALALQQTGDARVEQLAAAGRDKRFELETDLARDLAGMYSPGSELDAMLPRMELETMGMLPARSLLAKWALEARPADAPDRTMVLADAAIFDVIRGDRAQALARLGDASHALAADRAFLQPEIEVLRGAIELHGPRTDVTPVANDALLALRAGKLLDTTSIHSYGCERELRAAFATAAAGDGGPLAALFPRCDLYWMSAGLVLAVLPRVTQHRTELAAAVALFRDDYPAELDRVPLQWLAYAAMRRDLLRLAGDEAAATHWQQIIDRHVAVLADRDRLIALLILHS